LKIVIKKCFHLFYGPKIYITLNEYGQPVGRNNKEFGNFIGTLVRKNIPVSSEDWRLVDYKKKFELWTKVKVI
jgi:hypothetical protein